MSLSLTRRIGLALSLAFADFARARLGLSCNLLVLDEVMQHMDADGQVTLTLTLTLSLTLTPASRGRHGSHRPTHPHASPPTHQAAMARVLRELGAETTLVIAHGLASDALYGDFDAIDVVEKVSQYSTLHR